MHLESSREPAFTLLAAFVAAITATTLLAAAGGIRHVDADPA